MVASTLSAVACVLFWERQDCGLMCIGFNFGFFHVAKLLHRFQILETYFFKGFAVQDPQSLGCYPWSVLLMAQQATERRVDKVSRPDDARVDIDTASGGTCGCSAGWSDVACKCILQPGAPAHKKQKTAETWNMWMVFDSCSHCCHCSLPYTCVLASSCTFLTLLFLAFSLL